MTATDELRKLLDERGVEHYDGTERTLWGYEQTGEDTGIYRFAASEISGGFLQFDMFRITPEQAIGMTLGSGECRTVAMDCFGNPPYNTSGLNGNSTACGCSECGAPWSTVGMFRGNRLKHNFKACPICGRKVVGA